MRKRELAKRMSMLDRVTRAQRKTLATALTAVDSKTASIEVIERTILARSDCPCCGAPRVVKNGTAHGLQRFKCRDCGKTFTALPGTPLAGLHMRGKWLQAANSVR